MATIRFTQVTIVLAVLLGLSLWATPSIAKGDDDPVKYDVRQFTCPIGGQKFKQDVGYSAFPLMTLPDGSWLGDTEIGVQIPICPENGLVLIPDLALKDPSGSNRIFYADYTNEERTKLSALIVNPAYLALKNDGPYTQAWWLATQLKRPAKDRFFMLQRSTWATSDAVKRKQLVARFAKEGPDIIDAMDVDDEGKRFLNMYIINALREIGKFYEATALLDSIEASGHIVQSHVDPDSMFGPAEANGPMRLALSQKDDGRFAAELLPRRLLSDICGNELEILYGPTAPSTIAACKIRRDREQKEADDSEAAFALTNDTASLDHQCAATPVATRSVVLIQACIIRQNNRDRIAAKELTKDGPKLASDCETISDDRREGPLSYACITYETALGSALGTLLAKDTAAFAIFCPESVDEEELTDRARYASDACRSAIFEHKSKAEEQLLENPVALAEKCAHSEKEAKGDIARYEILLNACSTLARNRDDAAIAHLANDLVAFDKGCGRFSRTNNAGNEVVDLTKKQQQCQRAWRLRENNRIRLAAEAKGLFCFADAIYSPDRPKCVAKAEYDREMALEQASSLDDIDMRWLKDDSSLMKAASVRATSIIARAKTDHTYPKSNY